MMMYVIKTTGDHTETRCELSSVDAHATPVGRIKEMIEAKTSIPTHLQKLIYMGIILEDDFDTISSAVMRMPNALERGCNIIHLAPNGMDAMTVFSNQGGGNKERDFAHVTAHHNNRDNMAIHVKLFSYKDLHVNNSNYLRVNITPATTLEELKLMLWDKTGFNPETIDVVFRGHRIREGYALSDYNVVNGSKLHLILRCFSSGNIGPSEAVVERQRARILRPLLKSAENEQDAFPLAAYPLALARIDKHETVDCTFAAIQLVVAILGRMPTGNEK